MTNVIVKTPLDSNYSENVLDVKTNYNPKEYNLVLIADTNIKNYSIKITEL